MPTKNRPTVITGNWKMYKTIPEATAFIQELIPLVKKATVQVYLAVPFTALRAAADCAKKSPIVIGAQNMHDATEGAFTGEIAGRMLKDAGARFVILGHSERRRLFKESNAFINRKVKRALAEGLQPVVCIGETLEEREANQTEEVLSRQLLESLADVTDEQLEQLMIAYEPVWAIGSDRPATPEIAQEVQAQCRKKMAQQWGKAVAEKIVIQYGGSVNPENAHALLKQPDIDGLLIGGASLSVATFSEIINEE